MAAEASIDIVLCTHSLTNAHSLICTPAPIRVTESRCTHTPQHANASPARTRQNQQTGGAYASQIRDGGKIIQNECISLFPFLCQRDRLRNRVTMTAHPQQHSSLQAILTARIAAVEASGCFMLLATTQLDARASVCRMAPAPLQGLSSPPSAVP
jgi:hypothetical protein